MEEDILSLQSIIPLLYAVKVSKNAWTVWKDLSVSN